MNETTTLSKYVATTAFADVPDEVLHQMKRLVLDQLACQVACSQLPWTKLAYHATKSLSGSGPSTVVVYGDRLPADEAAFVNSAFAHGNEIDDAHIAYRTHPGSVVVPAAFAATELAGEVDGVTFLLAVALGCEVLIRVADAATEALKDLRFHNTSSAIGPFGAAAAVARILGLDATVTEHALSIAGYHSAGLRQHSVTGGSVKRLQTAIGSKAGLRSAWLAREGFTGPGEILEGSRGFLQSFSGQFETPLLVDGLGTRYLSLGPCLKRFSVKYRIHSTIDAIVGLIAEHGIAFDKISSLRVGVSETTRANHGIAFQPAEAPDDSNATQQAQLSLRFSMAVVAKYGPGVLGGLTAAHFNDPEVLDLARRIEVYREPQQELEPWMNWGCVVTATMFGGESYTIKVPAPVGSPRNPMSDAELEEKFHRLADPILGTEKTDAIVDAVWQIEETVPARDILPHCVAAQTG